MDFANDYIPQDGYKEESSNGGDAAKPKPTLESDLQDAYKAFSNSPWGSRIGGFLGSVAKQVRLIAMSPARR